MADAVVSGVVKRIGDLLVEEADSLSWVSKQVELLQTEFKLIQVFLKDADLRQDESETVRQLVAEIKGLSYKAENIIAAHAHKFGSRNGGGIQKFVRRCACILCEGVSVHKVGSQIKDIKARVSILKMRLQRYGIGSLIENSLVGSSLNEPQREVRRTFSHQREVRQTFYHLEHDVDVNFDVVGFDDSLVKLVEFLMREEEGYRVASICGMGGLGKTTLAKMVYNNPIIKRHFDCRSWSYISQQCQRRRVWEEILIKLLSPTKEERDEIQKLRNADIVQKLREVQCQKKCLVILDDIWDIETWNSLREAFPKVNTVSKILLTSRNRQVSLYADATGFLYELQFLNMERSWELLQKIAMSRRKDYVANAYIEKLGKEMIEFCGGLPLIIIVLGSYLATKHAQDEWEDVLKHIKSYIYEEDGGHVNKVLSLSYNDLPFHLKPCFLYLGHFPQDYEISTEKLIQMWMGEGFIPQICHEEGSEDTPEYLGEQYLRELMLRRMVQVGKISKVGRIETCQIHDLMRDFCISKAQQENFLQITKENIHSVEGSQGHFGKIRRLAITSELNDNYLKGFKFNEYSYLRSLHYFMPCEEFYFKNSKLLRVLNLSNYQGENLPEDIGRLIHLRFLSLENSNINKVPSSLGNLKCLQTLDLRFQRSSHYTRLRLPNIFKEMKQLRHLYLPYLYRVDKKLELGNLCYLQTLLNVLPETIKMPTSFRFNYLRILGFNNQDYQPLLGVKTGKVPHVIQIMVSSCPRIYKLYVCYCIKKLPETRQFSPNLAELNLENTGLEEDPMPTLEKLPNLKILCLLYFSFEGEDMVCSKGGFPLLQYLLLCLEKLEEWRVEMGAMPSLCHLEIRSCLRLKTIPDGLRFVKTLRELEISGMPKSFKDRLDEEGPDFYKVKHVPSFVFEHCDG